MGFKILRTKTSRIKLKEEFFIFRTNRHVCLRQIMSKRRAIPRCFCFVSRTHLKVARRPRAPLHDAEPPVASEVPHRQSGHLDAAHQAVAAL